MVSSVNSCNRLPPAVVSLGEEPKAPRVSGGGTHPPPRIPSPTGAVLLALTGHPPGQAVREDCLSTWLFAPLPGAKKAWGQCSAQAELGLGELHKGSMGRQEGRVGGHLRVGPRIGSPKGSSPQAFFWVFYQGQPLCLVL